jgi:Domain of unknown function (DUF4111)
MVHYNWTNVSKVIKAEVITLQSGLTRLLDQQLQGIYLHGSLALGGFQPARSDINIIAVVTGEIASTLQAELLKLLILVSNRPRPIDIYIVTEKALFPFQPPIAFAFHYDEQLRYPPQYAPSNAAPHVNPDLSIFLTVVQRSGIVLAGKPIAETIPPIPEVAFRDALARSIQAAQAHLPQDPSAFILNACRTVAYLQDGGPILAKDAGGAWGLLHMPEQFHALIQQALALYTGEQLKRPVGRAVLDAFSDTVGAGFITPGGVINDSNRNH